MNRLFPLFLAAILSTSVFAQDDVEKVKQVVKSGRCSDAIAPLQKIYGSSFRKLEGEKASAQHKIDVDIQAAKEAAAIIKGKKIDVAAKAGSNGKLFGSVTAANIAEAIEKQLGIKVDKKKIALNADIKNFGSYTAVVKLYNGISETIDVEVSEG